MSFSTTPSYRAPNRSQAVDTSIDYEYRPGDTTRDTNTYVSQDGRRIINKGVNVGVKKRRVRPSDLVDTFGDWVPLPGDGEPDLGTAGETEDEGAGAGTKRKRYESTVIFLNAF